MRHIDDSAPLTLKHTRHHLSHKPLLHHVEPVERFIENEQWSILDESACKQSHTLLAARQRAHHSVGSVSYSQSIKPLLRPLAHIGRDAAEAAHIVVKTRSHHSGCVFAIIEIEMHLGRYVANAALDVPDALATPTSAVEECNVVAIALWIIGIDEAQ